MRNVTTLTQTNNQTNNIEMEVHSAEFVNMGFAALTTRGFPDYFLVEIVTRRLSLRAEDLACLANRENLENLEEKDSTAEMWCVDMHLVLAILATCWGR